jgi:hypothetical protein
MDDLRGISVTDARQHFQISRSGAIDVDEIGFGRTTVVFCDAGAIVEGAAVVFGALLVAG